VWILFFVLAVVVIGVRFCVLSDRELTEQACVPLTLLLCAAIFFLAIKHHKQHRHGPPAGRISMNFTNATAPSATPHTSTVKHRRHVRASAVATS
jgi:hypothetical protein